MTTKAEIRNWVRPLIELQPDLVQGRDLLILSPVHHIMRGLLFGHGLSRHSPNISWFFILMFAAPGASRSMFWADVPVGNTDWPGFHECFEKRATESIVRYLRPTESVQEFYDFAMDFDGFFVGNLSRFAPERAMVLAALGRFEEAEALLAPRAAEIEQRAIAQLERGRAALAKRANSGSGKADIEYGQRDLNLATHLNGLLGHLRDRDGEAVALLLRAWEQESVTKWDVGDYWQPTSFPFEEVA